MQTCYFPMTALCVTGSEIATSHTGTFNLDFAYNADPWVYAPFDCTIKKIYHSSSANANTTWFESTAEVQGPTFKDYQTFLVSHMYNADFAALGLEQAFRDKKVFKQGEKIYKAGKQGNATGVHIHVSWGRGKFTGDGWHQVPGTNSWEINNNIHTWDAFYLKEGTQILKGSDPAEAYRTKWVYAPKYATMVDVVNKGIKTTDVSVNMREKPSTAYPVIGKLPMNMTLEISQLSTDFFDGFQWVKVSYNGVVGYSAVVASTTVVTMLTPEEQLKLALDAANKVIAEQKATINSLNAQVAEQKTTINTLSAQNVKQKATIDSLNTQVAQQSAELQSYSQVTTILYQKK